MAATDKQWNVLKGRVRRVVERFHEAGWCKFEKGSREMFVRELTDAAWASVMEAAQLPLDLDPDRPADRGE